MLRSPEPPILLSLDGLLKLLMALILLSVLVALLQSDFTIGAVRRTVIITALPLLLMGDLLSSIEKALTSGRAQSIFAIILPTIFSIVKHLRKTMENANISARTHKFFLTAPEYIDTAQLFAGRIKRAFAIAHALLIIVIGYIHVLRAGRSISENVMSFCGFIIHTTICIISLLYVVLTGLYNLMTAIMIKLRTHLRKSVVYVSITNLLLSIPDLVSHKLHSFWTSICDGLNHKLMAVLELILSDAQTPGCSSVNSSTPTSSATACVAPASNSNYQSPRKGRLRIRASDAFGRP